MQGNGKEGTLEDKILDLANSAEHYSREEIFEMLSRAAGKGFEELYTNLMGIFKEEKGSTIFLDAIPESPSEGLSALLESYVTSSHAGVPRKIIIEDNLDKYLQVYHNGTIISLKVVDETKGGMGEVWFVRYDLDHTLESIRNIFNSEISQVNETEEEKISNLKQAKSIAETKAREAVDDFGYKTYVFKSIKQTVFEGLSDESRDEFIARFATEASIPDTYPDLVATDKGGIVPIPFKGVLKDGRPYMGMPVLQTTPENKKYTLDEALDTMHKIAFEVSRIHKSKLVHRDLKWGNIFWNGEYPVIGDFGLVKELAEQDKTLVTLTGMIMGTPKYMSPEQANATLIDVTKKLIKLRLQKKALMESPEYETEINEINRLMNELHNVACKSDQYSLGVMAYEIFTGIPSEFMYLASDEKYSSDKLIVAIQNDKLDVRVFPHEIMEPNDKFDSEMVRNISAVILKATERDEKQRYDTTDDFVNDIHACIERKTPQVMIENPDYLEMRHMRRSGADSFLKEKKYALGREILNELVEKAVNAHDKDKKDRVLLEKRRTLEKMLLDYKEGVKKSIRSLSSEEVEEAGEQIRQYAGNLPNEEFVDFVPELLNLIYKHKIGPVEDRINSDKFPAFTTGGKWKLTGINSSMVGYWVDMLRSGGFNIKDRINQLLNNRIFSNFGTENLLTAYLTFGKEYEKDNDSTLQDLLLERANVLVEKYKENNCNFIRSWPEKEEDGGIGTESLQSIDALFNINKHDKDNTYSKLALKQVNQVIKYLMREDGSAYRYAVFDKQGNLIGKCVKDINTKIGLDEESDETWLIAQAYLIRGLVDAYRHTKDEKYKEKAKKAIDFFVANLREDGLSYVWVESEDKTESSYATVMAIPSMIDYADLTNDNELKKIAVKSLQGLVKQKLNLTQNHEGILKGPHREKETEEYAGTIIDWSLITSLNKLVDNELYKPRAFVSTRKQGELEWDNANYQAGFTGLDNAVADEQTEVRIMHDDKNIYFKITATGNVEQDYYDVLIGDTRFKIFLNGKDEAMGKKSYSSLGLAQKPDTLKFNIMRTRGKEEGKRITSSSWSPNTEDLYFAEKGKRRSFDDKLSIGYGKLILN